MADLTGWVHGNTITLDAPAPTFEGMRVLVRIETAKVEVDADATYLSRAPAKWKLPDLAEFRARLGAKTYPGNSVVELREE